MEKNRESGEMVEQGSHEELLLKKGQYYRLREMQQGNFIVQEDVEKEIVTDFVDEDEVMSYT